MKREFPNFEDLLEELPKVLDDSYFSSDTKGDCEGSDYKGKVHDKWNQWLGALPRM